MRMAMTALDNRLVGGKNYMLRHLTWQDDCNMVRAFPCSRSVSSWLVVIFRVRVVYVVTLR